MGLGILWQSGFLPFRIQDSLSESRSKPRHWMESRHSSAKFIALQSFKWPNLDCTQVFRLSEKNLRGLDVKEDIQLVYGKVYSLNSCKENWPGNKQKVKKAMAFQEGRWYDSASLYFANPEVGRPSHL